MERDPEKRQKEADKIKESTFFQGVNWDGLREEEAPFVPQTSSESDTSYFAPKKMFEVENFSGSMKNSNKCFNSRPSMIDFDFRTLNVKSLAMKNKEDVFNTMKMLGKHKK